MIDKEFRRIVREGARALGLDVVRITTERWAVDPDYYRGELTVMLAKGDRTYNMMFSKREISMAGDRIATLIRARLKQALLAFDLDDEGRAA